MIIAWKEKGNESQSKKLDKKVIDKFLNHDPSYKIKSIIHEKIMRVKITKK